MHGFVELNSVIKRKQQSRVQPLNPMNDTSRNLKRCPPKIDSVISTIKSMNKLEVEPHIRSVDLRLRHKGVKVGIRVLC